MIGERRCGLVIGERDQGSRDYGPCDHVITIASLLGRELR